MAPLAVLKHIVIDKLDEYIRRAPTWALWLTIAALALLDLVLIAVAGPLVGQYVDVFWIKSGEAQMFNPKWARAKEAGETQFATRAHALSSGLTDSGLITLSVDELDMPKNVGEA